MDCSQSLFKRSTTSSPDITQGPPKRVRLEPSSADSSPLSVKGSENVPVRPDDGGFFTTHTNRFIINTLTILSACGTLVASKKQLSTHNSVSPVKSSARSAR